MTKDGVTETRLRESGKNGEEYILDPLERHEVVNTHYQPLVPVGEKELKKEIKTDILTDWA